MLTPSSQSPIYVIDGLRTPFIKAKGVRGPYSAADLGVLTAQALFLRNSLPPEIVDQVIAGCVNPSEDEANIARIMGLRLGCGIDVPAYTVSRNCGSGLQAIDNAVQSLRLGLSECTLVIGTEAMSRAPLLASHPLTNWLTSRGLAKTWRQKMLWPFQCPMNSLAPISSLQHGLTDPTNGLIMGKTAQEIAYRYHLSRQEMDQYALLSHQKSHDAWEKGEMKDVITVIGVHGAPIFRDDGIRPDLSLSKLSKLKPVFEKYGSITAGNSSQITDGAGALLLASEAFVEKYQLKPLGIIRSVAWSGCDPRMMGLGPVGSMAKILTQENLVFEDIDCIEINEAFSAQILGVVKSFSDPSLGGQFCHIDNRYGELPLEKLNRWGGAIALGHPIAASGIRLVIRALTALRDHKEKRALVSLCIGGGQGGSALVESI